MASTARIDLPPRLHVLERGWLSANNVLGFGPEGATLVDSGYFSHADQTVALVDRALNGQPLTRLVNTHLHSDHCGGNAALQARYPAMQTAIPPGQADVVKRWDEAVLSYRATGQHCPRFQVDTVLQPGERLALAGLTWQLHAAPGHDPHALLLFQPDEGVLISGDALWENGFGVVFPELEGETGFGEVGDTLDLIASLTPRLVIPGHGAPFGGEAEVRKAIERARTRLQQFQDAPKKHLQYALKVLIKFRLLEWQRVLLGDLLNWGRATPYLQRQHALHGQEQAMDDWLMDLLRSLVASGAAQREGDWVIDR
jgi:glyoxylase-like metal-dependent hydrolase (beta-lactamase superfamily II)